MAKNEFPRRVAAYVRGLRTLYERRYAAKEYRRLAGLRRTRATPFHLTAGRARTIRAAVGGIVNGRTRAAA